MDSIDIMLLCLYTPFALAVLWVVGCLFFRRIDLVPRFIERWFSGNSNTPRSMDEKKFGNGLRETYPRRCNRRGGAD